MWQLGWQWAGVAADGTAGLVGSGGLVDVTADGTAVLAVDARLMW